MQEAKINLKEYKDGVKSIKMINEDDHIVYEIITLEDEKLEVDFIRTQGYRVDGLFYETLQALLTERSKLYRDAFSNALANKLKDLFESTAKA